MQRSTLLFLCSTSSARMSGTHILGKSLVRQPPDLSQDDLLVDMLLNFQGMPPWRKLLTRKYLGNGLLKRASKYALYRC